MGKAMQRKKQVFTKSVEAPPKAALKADEAGRYCGFSARTLRRLNDAGECPAPLRRGRLIVWRVSDLDLWLELGMPDRATFERAKEQAQAGAVAAH